MNTQLTNSLYMRKTGKIVSFVLFKLRFHEQGPAGRDFQLSGISGSGIAKNFGFGSGIGYICQKNYQSGIFGY